MAASSTPSSSSASTLPPPSFLLCAGSATASPPPVLLLALLVLSSSRAPPSSSGTGEQPATAPSRIMAYARREAFRRRDEHMRGHREEGKVCKVPWLKKAELDVGEQASQMWNDGGVRPPPQPCSSGGYRECAVAVPMASARATSAAGRGSSGRSKRWATAAAGRVRAMAAAASQDLLQKGRKLRQASSNKVVTRRRLAWSSSFSAVRDERHTFAASTGGSDVSRSQRRRSLCPKQRRLMSLMLLSPGSAPPHAVDPAGSIVASPRLASAQISRSPALEPEYIGNILMVFLFKDCSGWFYIST